MPRPTVPTAAPVYVGIDPSYTRTGIAILRPEHKSLGFYTLSEKIGKKDAPHAYAAAAVLAVSLEALLYTQGPYVAAMEYPPPVSSMSPVLYTLVSVYATKLGASLQRWYHPMELLKIMGVKKKSKALATMAGAELVQQLTSAGWVVTPPRARVSHDCYEALLYIHHYYTKELGHVCP